ncbi:hypothetical protein LBMAG42_17630 [Deltaproteobacteria bacterium]|nr:hypothetical protein LBMAG42_17630 [Deltaproteobacteria bacterium]
MDRLRSNSFVIAGFVLGVGGNACADCLSAPLVADSEGPDNYYVCTALPNQGREDCESVELADWLVDTEVERQLGHAPGAGDCNWWVEVRNGPDPCVGDRCCYVVHVEPSCSWD